MTFRRVLKSVRARLEHVGLAEGDRGHVGSQTVGCARFRCLFSGTALTTDFPCDLDLRLYLTSGKQEGSEFFSFVAGSGHAPSPGLG